MVRALKIIFNTLKTLSIGKILQILKLCIPHPLLTLLALYATIRSFLLAQKFFPETSSKSGIGNAFRHALWNCLIMMYCCKITSPQKALNFCKRMTDLHEELFPNEKEDKMMDLHNNKVGMDLFMEMLDGIHRQFFETSFFIEKLFEKTNTARPMKDSDGDYGNELVYIPD